MSPHSTAAFEAARGYGELGDLLADLMHRPAPLQVCAFCRTARHPSGKCVVCGALPAAGDPVVEPEGRPAAQRLQTVLQRPGVQAMSRLMVPVMLVPLMLFAGFGTWYAVHLAEAPTPEAVSMTAPIPVSASLVKGEELAPPNATLTLTPKSVPVVVEPAAALDPVEAAVATASLAAAPARSQSVNPARPDDSSARAEPRVADAAASALTSCDARNFFMRAVCVNDICAQSANRNLPRCVQAIAQRRLDERRRDALALN
ncbi:MAG: hypothetical protein ABWZ88_11585 [Variovorax sp.]